MASIERNSLPRRQKERHPRPVLGSGKELLRFVLTRIDWGLRRFEGHPLPGSRIVGKNRSRKKRRAEGIKDFRRVLTPTDFRDGSRVGQRNVALRGAIQTDKRQSALHIDEILHRDSAADQLDGFDRFFGFGNNRFPGRWVWMTD